MKILRALAVLAAAALAPVFTAAAVLENAGGEVRIPLGEYRALIDHARTELRPPAAPYAIGVADVTVKLVERDDRTVGEVTATLAIETFEDAWTLVPILPAGTALRDARVNGKPVPLVQSADGLAWSTTTAGTVTLELRYGIDARRSESGFVLPVPVTRAAATTLTVRYAGHGLDLAVVPATELRSTAAGGATVVTAVVPSTSSVLISWRVPTKDPFVMSRARYTGELRGDALAFDAEFDVEIFAGDRVTLPLMPSTVTLGDLLVDGERATVLERDGRFATTVEGRGMHRVRVSFQVPVSDQAGPPGAVLHIPRIPVSRFELTLPGRKELKVEPRAHVRTTQTGDATVAVLHVPMSDTVRFAWLDAIPEALRARARANATLYHAVHADEGVLHGQASVVYEISRGETGQLELDIPADVQVNRIVSPAGGISDWTEARTEGASTKRVTVFLDRAVKGEFVLEIAYERLLGDATRTGDPIAIPLLSAVDVHRQRGMVALLAAADLVLEPVNEDGVLRVGENQLPPFVRNRLAMPVAHTYKYIEQGPTLTVRARAPERVQGKFDAEVDTLISIGEVAMKGSASVTLNVKSGSILALALRLPRSVNILGVSGPSIRSQDIRSENDAQVVDIAFTQEMDGQLRLDVNYERITADAGPEHTVPTVAVDGAEIEHGRIAVEALSAVEVKAARATRLSSLDLNELPQQLVLKTSNPILLAYKYLHAEPPFELVLRVTRHREIDVQVAAIERAHYATLFTRDGLAVTTARFQVRNSRRQFLRLDLPAGSEIWSVFVDGKAEKPAHPSDADDGAAVLVKMINSATGFVVEIVYATRVPAMRFIGEVGMRLPRPDMVVTSTHWDVFLPTGPRYRRPDTNLDFVGGGRIAGPEQMRAAGLASREDAPAIGQPLRITVPAQGVHYAFEKLYANQSPEEAAFEIGYTSLEASRAGAMLSVLGVVLVWLAIIALGARRIRVSRVVVVACLVAGIVLLVGALTRLGAAPVLPSVVALVIAGFVATWAAIGKVRAWGARRRGGAG